MKKDKLIEWIVVSVLVLLLSGALSTLLYIGPILVSVVIGNIAEKSKLSKKNTNKMYFLSLGIVGLILSQVIILNVSRLTLTLNVLTLVILFVGVLLPKESREWLD